MSQVCFEYAAKERRSTFFDVANISNQPYASELDPTVAHMTCITRIAQSEHNVPWTYILDGLYSSINTMPIRAFKSFRSRGLLLGK